MSLTNFRVEKAEAECPQLALNKGIDHTCSIT